MTSALPVTSFTENMDSIYGTIRAEAQRKPGEEFQYVTLDGSVIRSVTAPGKGVKTNYKVNTGYGGPRPFNNSPMSPPMRGPQSPQTYPPPKPQMNPYATLPRAAGQSQEESHQQNYAYDNHAEQEYRERSVFEEEVELVQANGAPTAHFAWPPMEESRCTPTATPLYIAPPETQHVIPKPLSTQPQQQQQQWQSRSAPQLTVPAAQQKHVEIESSSDSYTSTSTTTTTTSEEYNRMYAAQVQAYQMQQAYGEYGSDTDYHMDMEVATMQQDQSFSSAYDYYSSQSGRRSAQECVDYIAGPVSTYHLIDMVRAATPKPETPPPKSPRRVEFSKDVEEKREEKIEKTVIVQREATEEMTQKNQERIEETQENVEEIESRTEELRVEPVTMKELTEHRKFTATPEIKIDIPGVKKFPPSSIPNPVPKEWISPMVRALTTAPDKPVEIPEAMNELHKGFESVHPREEKTVKFQEPPEEKEETKIDEPEFLRESPPKGSFITKSMTTAPTDSVKFAENIDEGIPLPEEMEPYMPPPIDMKPYYRDDYRPKSPFLSALTIAPDRSYTPYSKDVCSQLLDLPTPKEKLTMVDALTTASKRCYTPLNPENAASLVEDEAPEKTTAYEFFTQEETSADEQKNVSECRQLLSAFANVKGMNMLSPFQPRRESLNSNISNGMIPSAPRNSLVPSAQNLIDQRDCLQSPFCRSTKTQSSSSHYHEKTEHSVYQTTSSSLQSTTYNGMTQNQTIINVTGQQDSHETEQKVSFPPPPPPPCYTGHKKTYLSGLHKPESIPQYQRNWTVLQSQRPVRTPEPPELRENVPLAFVDTPRELTPSVDPSPITVQTNNSAISSANPTNAIMTAQHATATFTATKSSEQKIEQQTQIETQQRKMEKPKATIPIIVTENIAPVTMAFQSLDVPHQDAHPRPYTPSLINKAAPIIPFYQTAEKLVAEECAAAQGRAYDPCSPSPLPDRTRSPAPGPPPNPLSAIRAPRIKDTELSLRPTQLGSITTGQSYFGTQAAQFQTQEHGQIVSNYQTGYQAGSQTFTERPETVEKRQIGDTTIQTRSRESQLNEENRSASQTTSTTQVGNMQIERRRKVVEEFEHTQKAKTVEIHKSQGETKQITQYGQKGFVANQARRLSGLEQEISNISSQSQAISARAATLSSPSSTFPHFKSPEPSSTFPLKAALPPYDEPQRPSYIVSANATNKLASGPSTQQTSSSYGAANMASSASSHAKLSATTAYGTAVHGQSRSAVNAATSQYSSSAASFDATSLLTTTTTTPSVPSSKLTTNIPAPAYKPPVPFSYSALSGAPNLDHVSSQPQASLQQPSGSLTNTNSNQQPSSMQSMANNVASMPPPPPTSSIYNAPASTTGPASAYQAPPPQPASNIVVPNIVNDSSPASAGPNKSGAFGATSAPKRGRGTLNKAVGPGGRIPMCGCCQRQIRGPFITALGRIWCPEHFVCVNANCRRALQDIGFVEEKGDLYCEFCFEKYLAPTCSKCGSKIKGDCLNAIGKHYHPECFTCSSCGRLFGNRPFFLEEGEPYCEADWNELFTTKCFACGFPVEAGDRWVEALNHNYHSQCFNCTMCKKNLEGQSFYNKGGRPFCKNHAR